MRFDIENQLSAAQAFTGATTASTNSYQKQSASQNLSIGRRMAVLLIVTTAAGAGSTHVFDSIQSTVTALSAPDILGTITVLAAALTVGAVFELPFPQGTAMNKLHIGYQNTSTGGTTTVSMDAYLVPQDEIPQYQSFPKAVDALV